MYPLQKDQQLRWSVSPSGSKLVSLKHVFILSLSFISDEEPQDFYIVKSLWQLQFLQCGFKQ